MVIADGIPVKSCMTPLREGMIVESASGLPALPHDGPLPIESEIETIDTDVLIIGGGPSGLSAAIEIDKNNIRTILIDDKSELGGKLLLQTHKFFGSVEDSFAGTRGIDIGRKLAEAVKNSACVDIWTLSTALHAFKDKKVGILKDGKYILVSPKVILNAAGAREKFLRFSGNALTGIYGAGAFQTLVNRDLIKCSKRLFIVGGGNVGLIAGYHALQAGIDVVGLVEAMPTCGGYKVHADKLMRLGVPIYTSHSILCANGSDVVESVTITQIDKNFVPIEGTEKTFECDTVLIAVGLESLSEFTTSAEIAGMKVFAAGDASEIAEASSAMFNGKIVGSLISKELGADVPDIPQAWYDKAEILKSHPGAVSPQVIENVSEGIKPVIHCLQDIPCNPCTTVCPTNSIFIEDGSIMGKPIYSGSCMGCAKCLLICPGLAISLVDYRKDPTLPTVLLPYEVFNIAVQVGDEVDVVDIDGVSLGVYKINAIVNNTAYQTQQIKIQMPASFAQRAISFRIQADEVSRPVADSSDAQMPDACHCGERHETMLCLCERVSLSDVKKWIEKGVTDINQLKALSRASMGACGAKTCDNMLRQVLRQHGVPTESVVANTIRPTFVEVPLEKFYTKATDVPHPDSIGTQTATTSHVDDANIAMGKSQQCISSPSSADVIIIGAGSIGVPAAMSLAKRGKKVIVIDSMPSVGQVNNKRAIGGVRATHSDFGKIATSLRSIEIFSTWKEIYGDDIGWIGNGYSFVAYDEATEKSLKALLQIQHDFGLNISWLSPQDYQHLAPGIQMDGLRGATYSPDDGSCSPMLACNAFYFQSMIHGAEYRFRENVISITHKNDAFTVRTDKGVYHSEYLVNASGNQASRISKMLGIDYCPVVPDNHEAAITDPMKRFMGPMIVDIKSEVGSKNYYFYQNCDGQIIFCITPDPLLCGVDNDATSDFLPRCVSRMLRIYPALMNLKVRRQWRGQYPMTPDGFPIIGTTKNYPKLIQAVGMCGQGFMLGPGVGEVIDRIVSGTLSDKDKKVLKSFDPYRDFSGSEAFK
jgi:glycine/D-amino acid oxidase-like deaminating enzyme/Fe-S-cluster-containing hydrogenase component 2